MKRRLLIDMDGVMCDYMKSRNYHLKINPKQQFPQAQLKFFEDLEPMPGSLEAFNQLKEVYCINICTRPSTPNPLCYMEKRLWVEKHLGFEFCDKLILIEDKTQCVGDILIDDNIQTGDYTPSWTQIHFGSADYPDWASILKELL